MSYIDLPSETSEKPDIPDGQVFFRRNRRLIGEDCFPPNSPSSSRHTPKTILLVAIPPPKYAPKPHVIVSKSVITIQFPNEYDYKIRRKTLDSMVVEDNRFTTQPSLIFTYNPHIIIDCATLYIQLRLRAVYGQSMTILVAFHQYAPQLSPPVVLLASIPQDQHVTCPPDRDLQFSPTISMGGMDISVRRFNYNVVSTRADWHFEVEAKQRRYLTNEVY